MEKLKLSKRENGITVLFFQLCVVSNNVFGMDPQLYMIAKVLTLLFFGVVALRILQRGKVRVNQILLLPVLFTLYCGATVLWAYSASHVLSQMITQVQLLLLLLFTFWAMEDGVTVLDYLKAIYVSGLGMAVFALYRYGGLTQYMDAMLDGGRMGSEITNENTFGILFGNAALSTAYYFIMQKKRIHIVSFLIFAFFAFSSASRKAMLMIIAGVIAISVIHNGFRKVHKTLLIIAAVVAAAIFALQLPYFGHISGRIMKMLNGEQTATDITRESMIVYGLQLFRERPIHGFGLNNFRAMYIGGAYSHNNYIELLISGGLVALVLYYLMLLLPTAGLLFRPKKGEKLPALHLMLVVWVMMEMVFGLAMVQMYNKRSWLLAGVLMAEAVRVSKNHPTLQESNNENNQ